MHLIALIVKENIKEYLKMFDKLQSKLSSVKTLFLYCKVVIKKDKVEKIGFVT